MAIPGFTKKTTKKPLQRVKVEHFITCAQGKCKLNLDYGLLERLGFRADEGEFDMYRRDVDIAGCNDNNYEVYKILLNFKSTAAADNFMNHCAELWKDKNGAKEQNFKSSGRDKSDIGVKRNGNEIWIGYLYAFQ